MTATAKTLVVALGIQALGFVVTVVGMNLIGHADCADQAAREAGGSVFWTGLAVIGVGILVSVCAATLGRSAVRTLPHVGAVVAGVILAAGLVFLTGLADMGCWN